MLTGLVHMHPHRFQTKAGQWLWLKCLATIDRDMHHHADRAVRVRCVYTMANRDMLMRPPSITSASSVSTITTGM
jgi:hypothetical protein